jgi:NADPH:quinone reductase-like Zn-dependent oxidoreductase
VVEEEEPMRAVAFSQHGGPEVLTVRDLPTPSPGPGEALVKVSATGLNQVDRVIRMGYPGLAVPLPHVLGGDIVGTVEALGPGVSPVPVGTRVVAYPVISCHACALCLGGEPNQCLAWQYFGMHRAGGYAEYVVAPTSVLVPLPAAVDDASAVSLPVAALTAFHALTTVANLRAGQTLLLWGGTGALGTVAVQIAKALGARVITTGSTPERLEVARRMGADVVLDRLHDDVPARVRELAPHGVDVVLDYVGPATFPKSFELVRKGGQILLCGIITGRESPLSLHLTYLRHVSVKGLYLGTLEELRTLVAWVAAGKVKPYIGARLRLDEARRGHELLDAGQTVGKVALLV